MIAPFHKKYISALLHKPDLIINSTAVWLDTEDDIESEKGLNFLHASALLSRNEERSDWKEHYSQKPPYIKHLFAYVLGDSLEEEDRKYIIENFPEAKFLKQIYDTVEPDEETLSEEPLINNAFEFETETKQNEKIPGKTYFDDIGPLGQKMNCRECGASNYINGSNRFRLKAEPIDRIVYQYEHQCQGCGKLKMADFKDPTDTSLFLKQSCECGGEFRRDKPLFCSICKVSKKEMN